MTKKNLFFIIMVPANFHDVTDDKKTRISYSDTSAEIVEARVGLTSFEHVQNCYYNS